MKREPPEGSLDPEAALSESDSALELSHNAQPTTTTITTNEQPVDKTESGGNQRKKNSSDVIPLTHPPPPQQPDGKQHVPPKLIHSSLHKIPMQVRYAVYGVLSSVLFLYLYNFALERSNYVPSTIYAATYLAFIPIQHAMAACMVFGWPKRYFPSLASNVPIGLTAIALGSFLTAELDKRKFDEYMEDIVRSMGFTRTTPDEFYTSSFVLIVTSFWSFLLSVFVNAPEQTPDKKEL